MLCADSHCQLLKRDGTARFIRGERNVVDKCVRAKYARIVGMNGALDIVARALCDKLLVSNACMTEIGGKQREAEISSNPRDGVGAKVRAMRRPRIVGGVAGDPCFDGVEMNVAQQGQEIGIDQPCFVMLCNGSANNAWRCAA